MITLIVLIKKKPTEIVGEAMTDNDPSKLIGSIGWEMGVSEFLIG